MGIYLSEEKAKKNNIDLNKCYQKIDKYFKSCGVEIVSKGIYKGGRKDFDTFAIAQGSLPDTKCFFKSSRLMVYKLFWRWTRKS